MASKFTLQEEIQTKAICKRKSNALHLKLTFKKVKKR